MPSIFIFSIVVGALPGERATTSTPKNDTGTKRINNAVEMIKMIMNRSIFSFFPIGACFVTVSCVAVLGVSDMVMYSLVYCFFSV